MISYPNVKLNLGLHVLRKRPDGYHDIETLFVPYMGIHDTLEVISGDDYSRTSATLFARYGEGAAGTDPGAVAASSPVSGAAAGDCGYFPELRQGVSADGKLMITLAKAGGVDWEPLSDLCAKAYALLDAELGLPPVKIFLEKTAPVGAGLGGGSADAAFTLSMLSELCGLGLSEETLAAYATRLGSDCAFFVYNRPMIGRGRGEVLEPFELNLEGYRIEVIVPEGITVSTAEAYRGVVPREAAGASVAGVAGAYGSTAFFAETSFAETAKAACTGEAGTVAGESFGGVVVASPVASRLAGPALADILSHPVGEWKSLLVNDFETTVFAAHPELEMVKASLYESGAVYAAMSGSGSVLFGIYKEA